jgi:hypothetical protein
MSKDTAETAVKLLEMLDWAISQRMCGNEEAFDLGQLTALKDFITTVRLRMSPMSNESESEFSRPLDPKAG